MNFVKTLILISAVIGFTMSNAAATQINPLETNIIDSNETQSIQSSSPFNASKLPGGDVAVSPGLQYSPGTYNQTVEYEMKTEYYELKLQPYIKWNVTPESFNGSVNIGSNPEFDNFTVNATSNTDFQLSAELVGNISNHARVPPSTTVYPSLNETLVLSFDNLAQDTEIGRYTGKINLSGGNNQKQVPLSFQFQDQIKPEIQEMDLPSFKATKPKKFTVQASDNLQVTAVNARIMQERKVQKNNETQLVNKTIENLQFERKENTEEWNAKPEGNTLGEHFIEINVTDKAGNTNTRTEIFHVEKLDVITVDNSGTYRLDPYRKGQEITVEIGKIKSDTQLTVNKSFFNQPLSGENESWSLGIKSNNEGIKYFREGKDKVTFSKEGTLSLVVKGSVNESYNGRLSFETLPQHVNVSDFRFKGSFKPCTVPKTETYSVLNGEIRPTIRPVNSTNCKHTRVEVHYNLSWERIDSEGGIIDDLEVITPKQRVDSLLAEKDNESSRWKATAQAEESKSNFLLFLLILSIGGLAFAVHVYPTFQWQIRYFTKPQVKRKLDNDSFPV